MGIWSLKRVKRASVRKGDVGSNRRIDQISKYIRNMEA